jgi:selenophosphate synthase
MTVSAARAAEAMRKAKAHACTDVTGFGLLGHAYEMARASNVSFTIESKRVPLLPEVLELIGQGMLTRGDKTIARMSATQSISRQVSQRKCRARFSIRKPLADFSLVLSGRKPQRWRRKSAGLLLGKFGL